MPLHLFATVLIGAIYTSVWAAPPARDDTARGFNLEVGSLTIIDTYQKKEFTRVNFTAAFDNPPLVFTLPTTDGANSAAHRIKGVDRNGFDIITVEPPNEDGEHIDMSLNFLAIENPGGDQATLELDNGAKFVVGTVSTRLQQSYDDSGLGNNWERISFPQGVFDADAGKGKKDRTIPAVLAQIQTMNNEKNVTEPLKNPKDIPPSEPWMTVAVDRVTDRDMRIALERSESEATPLSRDEVIAYLAAAPTARDALTDSRGRSIEYEIIRTGNQIRGWGSCDRVYFSAPWPKTPVVLATKNTRDWIEDRRGLHGDGGWLRRCGTTRSYVRLSVDEIRRVGGNRDKDGNRSHGPEAAGVFLFAENFVVTPVNLHHFQIEHDGTGLTCAPEDIVIKACEDPDCNSLFSGSVTLNLRPSGGNSRWSGSGVIAGQVTFSGGSRTLRFDHFRAGDVSLGIGDGSSPVPSDGVICKRNGVTGSCVMRFYESGFELDIPDQVAGLPAIGTIRAVTQDPSSPRCLPTFENTTQSLAFTSLFVEPTTPNQPLRLNGATLPVNGDSRNLNIAFDARGEATLTLDYADAGKLGLEAEFRGSGEQQGLVMVGNDHFVFRPDRLEMWAGTPAGEALDTTSVDGRPVQVAGAPFVYRLRALNAKGGPTPNYRPVHIDSLRAHLQRTGPAGAAAEGVLSLSAAGSIPSTGSEPATPGDYLSAAIDPASFAAGGYEYATAAYSEVGYGRLRLQDADYHGHRIAADPIALGRFIPARFQIGANLPLFSPGCGGFSYLNQPFGYQVDPEFTIRAVNAQGQYTRNYGGPFWKLNTALAGRGYTDAAGAAAALTVDAAGAAVVLDGADDFDAAAPTLTLSGELFTYLRPASPLDPFAARADLTLDRGDLIDGDGVCHQAAAGICNTDLTPGAGESYSVNGIVGTDLRYGRGRVDDAYGTMGSAGDSLTVLLRAEYWDLSDPLTARDGWLDSVDDACSTVEYALSSSSISTSAAPTSPLTLDGGRAALTLTATDDPGGDGGRQTITPAWPPWLPGDEGTATFGIFRGHDRFIHWREQ